MSLATPARDERGIALVMALGMLLVLAIVGTTVALPAVASTHHSAYSAQEQTALSVLAANVPTTSTLLPPAS
jgi:Tfp pilus assembly protein PilX